MIETTDIPKPFFLERNVEYKPQIKGEGIKNIQLTIQLMERKNRDLRLNLKAKWYNMIESGFKREEYREIKPYWFKRLTIVTRFGSIYCKRFDTVTFVYGYTKREMKYEVLHIGRGKGVQEWGAEPDKEYFVIRIGRRIK